MDYFTICNQLFVEPFEKNPKQQEIYDRFLSFLRRSGVGELICPLPDPDETMGRPSYDGSNLFAGILVSSALRRYSLRDMEDMMANDLRCLYVSSFAAPSYRTIGNYISRVFAPNADRIMAMITQGIADEMGIDLFDVQYVDGSKFEADANKYKFRWKPVGKRDKLLEKMNEFIADSTGNKTTISNAEDAGTFLENWKADLTAAGHDLGKVRTGKGIRNPSEISAYLKLAKMYAKLLEYDRDIAICGKGRNSYYLTDPDATAMCMKEDYYSGMGSNFHAAYNVQVSVSYGIIVSSLVTQDRSDFRTFKPFLEKIKDVYGRYPLNVCADSGYGSTENYRFIDENTIGNYVKYTNWEGEIDGRRPPLLNYGDDGILRCLAGAEAIIDGKSVSHPKRQASAFYTVNCVRGCPFRQYCRRNLKKKSGMTRRIEFSEEFLRYTREAKENLLSAKGIEVRVNRSIQVEGSFGNMKENMRYERFRRTGLDNVSAEFVLQCLGVNIRKLLRFYETGTLPEFWKAPEDLQPELPHKFRKCVTGKQRKKKLSVNEKAKRLARLEKHKK